ncbi:ParA family protein [Xenorhabdus bovienii]|uniref:ATPase MipZ family protein n=1 Tax=Xenorhabdus bovienii str. kraussei Becker Underwood TaxID=1398204 RepID=A0A077PTI0_XENBV|nr:ATPase [Xenorhabdus bovienii]CDH24096.1 ATPase MipZ family protein [Xenorhabdus bovienii str. kraussei Becker Underwood]
MAIYALSISKGGVGKTTSGVHIIDELDPDVVIDMDLHHSLSIINKLRPDDKKWPIVTISDKAELLAVLKKIDEEGKTAVIDCGGFDADINRAAAAVADVIIVPANDDVTEQIGLAIYDKILAGISLQMGRHIQAHVLMCKTQPNQKHFPNMDDTMKKVQHMKLLNGKLSYRKGRYGFTDSLRKGMGVTQIKHGRSSQAGREVIELVKELRALTES